MHEFMHALGQNPILLKIIKIRIKKIIKNKLGFHHEQSRADRDSYVFINFALLPGQQDQYDKEIGSAYTTPYDYQSLMHYPASAGLYVFRV